MTLNFNAVSSRNNNDYYITGINNRQKYSYLAPLKQDTVSFGQMKKNQFDCQDLVVVYKFKAPIEKFNQNEDFQKWCSDKIRNEYINKNYKALSEEASKQRREDLDKWYDYCFIEQKDVYNNALCLFIIDGITSKLKPDDDTLPPPLNKKVLADTINQINETAKTNPQDMNFLNLYTENLYNILLKEEKLDENLTGWIEINSKENDFENFDENVDKLKTLSYHNWCTRSFNAKPYLEQGNFHIYMEHGKPKLGVRFKGSVIQEIQGEKNNGEIPVKYLDIIKEHTNIYEKNKDTLDEIKNAEKLKEDFEQKLGKPLNEASNEDLLKAVNMFLKRDETDGKMILKSYNQPSINLSWEDLGINENDFFKDIKEITKTAHLENSKATNLGSLENVGGNLYLSGSKVKNLGNLKEVSGLADFSNSIVSNTGKLEIIGKNAYFANCPITNLGQIRKIGKDADFEKSNVKNLANLEEISGNALFSFSPVCDTGKLQIIGGCAIFTGCPVTNLQNIRKIGGNTVFSNSNVINLGSLEEINGNAVFSNSNVLNTGNLKRIGGNTSFKYSPITQLGNLEYIGNNADFSGSDVENLGKLKYIGGNALFGYSPIKDLGNLKIIGKNAYIENSYITEETLKGIEVNSKMKNEPYSLMPQPQNKISVKNGRIVSAHNFISFF